MLSLRVIEEKLPKRSGSIAKGLGSDERLNDEVVVLAKDVE